MKGDISYKTIYKVLNDKYIKKSTITAEELSEYSGLKISTTKVYIRNKLRGKFIKACDNGEYIILEEIRNVSESNFIDWMSQKDIKEINEDALYLKLIDNSIQAMLSAIEIHNKPQISFRYQVVIILVINAWELALKAFIAKYQPDTILIKSDGTTKPFPECLRNVESTIGKSILPTIENIELLYKYRCDYIHFYSEELDIMLFSLVQKSVIFYNKFISIYLNKKLSDFDDFFILPIGFKKAISPLDFISNDSFSKTAPEYVKSFFNEIINKTNRLRENDIDELVFVPFAMNFTNVKRVKNADIIAAIDKQSNITIQIKEDVIISDKESAKEIRIKEEDLYGKIYNLRFADIVEFCNHNIPGWKRNNEFYAHMRNLKKVPKMHKKRLLDPDKPEGSYKDFYSREIFEELIKRYE